MTRHASSKSQGDPGATSRHSPSALQPTAANASRCSGVTVDGRRCEAHPRRGEQTCFHHYPARNREPRTRAPKPAEHCVECHAYPMHGSDRCWHHAPSNAQRPRCQGLMRDGSRCTRLPSTGEAVCTHHRPAVVLQRRQADEEKQAIVEARLLAKRQCVATSADGRPCRTVARSLSGRCHSHERQQARRDSAEPPSPTPPAPSVSRTHPPQRRRPADNNLEPQQRRKGFQRASHELLGQALIQLDNMLARSPAGTHPSVELLTARVADLVDLSAAEEALRLRISRLERRLASLSHLA